MTPGKTLSDMLNKSGMTQNELALRTEVSEKHISTIINDERGISLAFARKLGHVFEDTKYWLALQAEYDAEILRKKEENEISQEEIGLLKPLHEIMQYFIELQYMHNNCSDVEKVIQLRDLLKISNLLQIPKIAYNAAYRAQLTNNVKVDPYVLFAWQKLCEKQTEANNVKASLDVEKLQNHLPEIKAMMFGAIKDSIKDLQSLLIKCGIIFQVVKNFRGAPVQGFIKKIEGGKLILCLTIRGQRADTFWFTLFHELAHIINGDYNTRFVDFDSVSGIQEEKADIFARDMLIPLESYKKFINTKDFSKWVNIETFAKEVNVQPFIVLGRLQKDGYLDWCNHADKVMRYKWA